MPNTDPLVVVIGAGASKEVALPLGSELTASIAKALDFKVDDFGRLSGGDRQIRECLYKLAQSPTKSLGSIHDYFQAALKIRDAMPLAPSIDNFIDSHRMDKKIAAIGKLAISACILNAERESALYVDKSNSYNRVDFKKLSGTWYTELFSIVSQHCSQAELEARLARLTIISFNYDRCVKQFLRQSLLTYYTVSETDADSLVSKVTVLYPYGSIGQLRFETGGLGVDYGEQISSDDLLGSAASLKTFTESADSDSDDIKAIRSSVAGAKLLVFLGFAFHPLNLELLYSGQEAPASGRDCDVYCTAIGVSNNNCESIRGDLTTIAGYARDRTRLHQDLTARGLMSEYSRRLARLMHSPT